MPCRVVKYSHTSTKLNMYFLGKIPTHVSETEILNKGTEIRDDLLKELPIYHTRAMRSEFIKSCGRVTGCKTAIRREAYHRLTERRLP